VSCSTFRSTWCCSCPGQALSAPRGVPLWVSDVLAGSTHDLTAAREHVLPGLRPYLKDLPVLADSAYEALALACTSR